MNRSTTIRSVGDEFRRGLQSAVVDDRLEHLVLSIPERKQRMASLILKMSVSLDGYVASPDKSTDWLAAGRSDDSTTVGCVRR